MSKQPKNTWFYNRFLDSDVELTKEQQTAVEKRISELAASRTGYTSLIIIMCVGVTILGFIFLPMLFDWLITIDIDWIKPLARNKLIRVFIALTLIIGWVGGCLIVISRMHTRPLRQALAEVGHEFCIECGYPLIGLDKETSKHCPECGWGRQDKSA